MRKICKFFNGVLFGTLLVVCFCSCGKDTAYYVEEETKVSEFREDELIQNEDSQMIDLSMIYVYVCGEIRSPGVYTLPDGSRVCELFELAGGFTEHAATDYWNQARVLKDGEMIYVPARDEVEDRHFGGDSTSYEETNDSNKVNINTASKEELMTLPGIGEARALAILAYRQANGSFSSIEDIKKVEGIKEAVFSKMKDYIEI